MTIVLLLMLKCTVVVDTCIQLLLTSLHGVVLSYR